MEYGDFWRLACEYKQGAPVAETASGKIDDAFAYLNCSVEQKEHLVYRTTKGSKLTDIIPTTQTIILLISKRMQQLFTENNFTGWCIDDAVLIDKSGNNVEGYGMLRINGKCGPVDTTMGEIVTLPPRVPTGKVRRVRRGLFFDLNTWGKTDFYIPEGTGHILITSRVHDAIVKSKFTNVFMENIADYERSVP